MIFSAELDRPLHRNFTRPHDFLDTQGADQRDECLDLVSVARHFDRDHALPDIDDMRAEGAHDRVELRASTLVDADLDYHHLALEDIDVLEVDNLDDGDELVELLVDLLEHLLVASGDQHDPRHRGIERVLIDGEGLDIKTAARKKSGHACEHAEFVLYQDRYRMTCHAAGSAHSWPDSPLSVPLADSDGESPSYGLLRPA